MFFHQEFGMKGHKKQRLKENKKYSFGSRKINNSIFTFLFWTLYMDILDYNYRVYAS